MKNIENNYLQGLLQKRIVFFDGAMGTMIQNHGLEESDFRNSSFLSHRKGDFKGNNDLLSLTRPELILGIHSSYLRAGSDIISTNTFNANRLAQADYGLEDLVTKLNYSSAQLAKKACQQFEEESGKKKLVAGAIGPTNKTASISPDVNDPSLRNVSFDELQEVYEEQITALIKGGVDLLLVETVFDTLNLKACLMAIELCFLKLKQELPVIISVTITDKSGRTLSGQTIEAFWASVQHARPLAVGINCALGAEDMRPYIEDLANIASCYISCYPNAGLPNPLSETGYDQSPAEMSSLLQSFANSSFLNIVGGCCGTTPEHIAAIYTAIKLPARTLIEAKGSFTVSGLETYL